MGDDMTTANDKLRDLANEHAVYLRGYSNKLAADALKLIADNTQSNQPVLANLQLGTSANVQGLMIQGTGGTTAGAVGTADAAEASTTCCPSCCGSTA